MKPIRLVLVVLLLLAPGPAFTQEGETPGGLTAARADEKARSRAERLASPRSTMRSFLVAMNDLWDRPSAWNEAISCLDLDLVPDADGRALVRQLYAILNRVELVDVEAIPDAAAMERQELGEWTWFPDRVRHRNLLRRIGPPAGGVVLTRNDAGLWRFDSGTVATLPALEAQLADLPLVAGTEVLTFGDWVEERVPKNLIATHFMGVKVWQWIGLFFVILLGLVADALVRGVLRVTSHRLAEGVGGREDPEQLRRTLRPIGLTAAALVWLLALRIVDLRTTVELILQGALQTFLVISATLSAWRLIDLAAGVALSSAEQTESKIDDILVPLVSRALKLFVATMGLVYAADALDLPIAPLLASLTVAGVGFSFAAKDTVENFFGSIAVILDRPFDIGDWIVIDDTEGIVEAVGFRSTRVRTFYNSQITVPNANLVRARVDNYGRRRFRRWKTTLGVQYDTPPERLIAFTEGIRELIRTHPYTRKDYYQVWCNEFGASSLDVMLYMFFEVPDWNTELRERERLFLDIVRLADQLGVQFAFPTQTLHVFPGEPAAEPAAQPGARTEGVATTEGVRTAQRLMADQPWRLEKPGPVVFSTAPTELLDAAGNPVESDDDTSPQS
ncbi:MAG: mechanosensitive ion channel family protein [bacterium]|nr:mechanosensitive ion channel family protein [bacterium]